MFTVNKREKKKEEEEKLKCEMNQMMDDGCRVDDKVENHLFFCQERSYWNNWVCKVWITGGASEFASTSS